MLQKIVHKIARKHHFWRDISFSELAEIYASMSLRSFGFGIIGIFVPVFLYKNGVDLRGIFLFYSLFFLMRIPIASVAGFIVARIGPKHSIAVSTILLVAFLSSLLTFTTFRWPLGAIAFLYAISNGLFFVAYHTDFSKIKSSKHGGKELGWLYIFERAGSALGPLIGGLLASFVSVVFTIGFAVLVLIVSLVPLFMSREPVKTHQKITFKGFQWKKHIPDYLSLGAFNIENIATVLLWPLYLAVAIFAEDSYAKIGAIVATATVISMLSARFFGRVVDNDKSFYLLRYGVSLNALTHFVRSMVTASGGAVAVSLLNEPTTLSYRLPLTQGFYDAADNEEGYRIVYIISTETAAVACKALACIALFLATYFYDPSDVLRYSFIVVGFVSLGIFLQRFPTLKKV
jgi:MFS family permease